MTAKTVGKAGNRSNVTLNELLVAKILTPGEGVLTLAYVHPAACLSV